MILPKVKFAFIFIVIGVMVSCTPLGKLEREKRQIPLPTDDIDQTINFTLYFPPMYEDDKEVGVEDRLVSKGEAMALLALHQLMVGPYREGRHTFIFPRDTKLLSLSLQDKIVYINFDKDIFKDAPKDIGKEVMAYCIIYTLTELEEIDKVQILAQGQAIDREVKGVRMDKPLGREDISIVY